MYNFNFNESDMLSKSQNENILDELEIEEDKEDFNYEDFVQQAIASGDVDTLILINEIDVEDEDDSSDNQEVIEDDESFSIVEKDGQNWKVLSTAKGKYNAARKYNECITKTKNEVRLVSLKDLEKMNESRKNEAPANSESLFTALMSELNTVYKCEITDEGFLRCTDDGGNFIEIATVKNTDPVEMGMRVTFTDGTQSETVYYIYDNIQAVNDFIQAVFISEVNAYNDMNEVEAEEVQTEEKEDIELEDENQAQEEIDKNVEEVEEESEEEKTESLKRRNLNEDKFEDDEDDFDRDLTDSELEVGKTYALILNRGQDWIIGNIEDDADLYSEDEIKRLEDAGWVDEVGDIIVPDEEPFVLKTKDKYGDAFYFPSVDVTFDGLVGDDDLHYYRVESLKRKSLNEDVIPAVYDSLIIRYKDKHDRNDFDEIVKILKDLRKTATFITDSDIREDLEGWRFPEEDIDEIINAIKVDKNESLKKVPLKESLDEYKEYHFTFTKDSEGNVFIDANDYSGEYKEWQNEEDDEEMENVIDIAKDETIKFDIEEMEGRDILYIDIIDFDYDEEDAAGSFTLGVTFEDVINESLNENKRQDILDKISKEVHDKIAEVYDNDPDIMEYVYVEPKIIPSHYDDGSDWTGIEVRAEQSYGGMMELAEKLDPIVRKYDKYSYFDMEDSGIISAAINLDRIKESLNESDDKFNYMMLDRLKTDCEYFLGNGNGYEKHLWAGNVEDQIAEMRKIYDKLPEKPDWISLEDIDRYEKEMLTKRDSKNEVKEITRDEWNRTSDDYKMIKDGKPYLVYLDDETHATVLGPCKIIDESLEDYDDPQGQITLKDAKKQFEKLVAEAHDIHWQGYNFIDITLLETHCPAFHDISWEDIPELIRSWGYAVLEDSGEEEPAIALGKEFTEDDLKKMVYNFNKENGFYESLNEDGTVSDMGVAPILPASYDDIDDSDDELFDITEGFLFPDSEEESDEDKEEEVNSLMGAAIEDINQGQPTASEWIEDAQYVFNSIKDDAVKNRLRNKYSQYLESKKNEASAELNKVIKDLAANDKTDVDKEINKLYKEEPEAKSNVADGSPILGATSPDNIVPTIDKAIMNKAIFAATSYANNGPQMFAKLQESFKNIDRKTIDDLMNSKDVAGIAKYLYESEIKVNKNEDTFTDPQMNVVNSNSTTVATGNSSETPKLADDIDPAPTEVQDFPKDKSEIENTNANNKEDQLAKDSGTEDIPTDN